MDATREGSEPFLETSATREPQVPLTDNRELYKECMRRIIADPEHQIETLREHDEDIKARIDGEFEYPDVDLSDVEEGDTLTVELDTGEVFEQIEVTDSLKHFAEDEDEETIPNFTLEGDVWEQVRDRVDSDILDIHQESEAGGEPLHQPILHGLSRKNGELQYNEFGQVVRVEKHDND
jgi:hypothetical protein